MKKTIAILLVLFLFVLSGCAKSEEPNAPKETDDASNVSQETDNGSEKTDNGGESTETLPTEYRDDSDENVTFDATVSLPDAAKAGTLSYADSQFIALSPDDVVSAFGESLSDTNYETFEEPISDELTLYHYYFKMKNAEEKMILRDNGAQLIYGSKFDNALSYIFYPDRDSVNYNADAFTEQDFSFATRESVIAEMKEILEKLGLQPAESYRIYSLSGAELEQEKARQIGNDASLAGNSELNAVSEWEDCYYAVLDFAYDGVAQLQRFHSLESIEGSIYPSRFVALVTKDGFQHINIEGYTTKGNEQTGDILSLEEAAEALKQAYSLVILGEPIWIDAIEMCYMPWKKQLKPVYAFHGSQGELEQWFYIDAISGEQVI